MTEQNTEALLTVEDQPTVRLDDIHLGNRFREEYGKKETEDLALSLQEDGLIHPIALRPPTAEEVELGVDKPYVLVAGGRRYMAARMLGWEAIPAHVREDMSILRARVLELYENLKRKDMTWEEEVSLSKEILRLRQEEDPNVTQQQVAAELGMGNSTFTRNLQTAEAIEKNPSLRKSSSKHAALRAQKVAELQEMKDRKKDTVQKIKAEDFRGRISTMDMREWLPNLHEDSIDLMCADLPYGIDYWEHGHKNKGPKGLSEFDDSYGPTLLLYQDVVPLMVRATRETGWIVCFTSRELFGPLSNLFEKTCATHGEYQEVDSKYCAGATEESDDCRFLRPEPIEWIWHRPNSRNNPRYKEFHARNDFERILVVNMGKAILYGELPCSNVLVHDQIYGGQRIHANEKPLDLYREIIFRTTQEGDRVADPCFGSGKCLAAAASLARDFLGNEMNDAMVEPALGLISQSYRPLTKDKIEAAEKQKQLREMSDIDEGVYDFEEEEEDA